MSDPTRRTLAPEDIPLQNLAQLEQRLVDEAASMVSHARAQLAASDLAGAAARYEGSLARFLFARELAGAVRETARAIAELHDQRTDEMLQHTAGGKTIVGFETGLDTDAPTLPPPMVSQEEINLWHADDQEGTQR
jgi:hypothetical protein